MHHDFFEKTMPFLRVFPSFFGSPFPRSIAMVRPFSDHQTIGITDRIRKVLKLAYKGGMSSITRSTPRVWPNIQLGDLTVFGNGSFPVNFDTKWKPQEFLGAGAMCPCICNYMFCHVWFCIDTVYHMICHTKSTCKDKCAEGPFEPAVA